MMTQEREADADLWFVSALDTEKISEIKANPKVTVIYFRDRDNAYISLAGVANIQTDKAFLTQHWQESWRPWFPQGPEQQNLCMINVDAKTVEMWAPQGGSIAAKLEIVRAYLTGDQARINPPVEATIDSTDNQRRSA